VRAILLAIGVALGAQGALADGGAELDTARRLLDKGDASQAIAELERNMLRYAGNPDFDYLLGLALHRGGRSGEALFALERILMVEPGRVDVRLMIAQISADRGAIAHAREVLGPLSGQKLDAAQNVQLEKIQAVIAEKAASQGLSIRGYLTVGVGRDSNVTGGPNLKEIVMPGVRQTPPPPPGQPNRPTALGTAEQTADRVGMVEAGATLVKAMDENLWLVAKGSYNVGFSDTRNDVEDGYTNLDLGLVKRVGKDNVGVALLAQEYRVAQSVYRNTVGLRLNWMHPLSESSRLGAYAQQLAYGYPARVNNINNATRTVFGMSGDTAFDDLAVQYGLYGGDEIAKDPSKPHFSYRLRGVHLGGSLRITDDLRVSAGAAYEERNHLSRDALFLLVRKDTQRTAGVSASYRLGRNWHFVPQYTFTDNASTAGLYTYSRRVLMLQMRWDFDNEKN
jgi:hypothetical protein